MATYKHAIEWIAEVDDTEWVHDPESNPSVTACLVADLFGKEEDQVRADIRKALNRMKARERRHAALVQAAMA